MVRRPPIRSSVRAEAEGELDDDGGAGLLAALGCLACCGVLGAAALGSTGRRASASPRTSSAGRRSRRPRSPVRAEVARPVAARLLPRGAGGRHSRRMGRGRAAVRGVARPRVAANAARPVVALALAVLAGGIYLGALAVLTTPNDWDGLTYHETRALLWDQQGGVGYVPSGNDPRLDGATRGLGDRPVPGDRGSALGTVRRGLAVPGPMGEPGRGRRAGAPSRSAARGGLRRADIHDAAGRHSPRRGDTERPPRRVAPPRRRCLPHQPRDVRARRRKRRARSHCRRSSVPSWPYRSSWPSCSRACRATVVAGRRWRPRSA